MPKATEPHTKSPYDPAPIPSAFDLTLHVAALWRHHHEQDLISVKAPADSRAKSAATGAMATAEAEIEACDALIMVRPIMSMADAAALAVRGFLSADGYGGDVRFEEAGAIDEMSQLQTVFARLAILTAGAAGIELADLRSEETASLIRRFARTSADQAEEVA